MKTLVSKETKGVNEEIFNEKLKREFLDESVSNNRISVETAMYYERVFNFTQEKESQLNKDLSEFSFPQLEDVLRSFESKNKNTVESYGRVISGYLNWNVRKGNINFNYLANLKTQEFAKYVINAEIYMTEKQLQRYEDNCENYQDAVILRLLFIGVGGKKMSEIRNLKKSDIEGNMLKLTNSLETDADGFPTEFTTRYLEVDDRTIHLIEEAMGQTRYKKRNGDMEEYNNINDYTELVQNDYIVRPSFTRNQHLNAPIDKFVIYRRIKSIGRSLGIEDFGAKYIQRSGMVYLTNQLMTDDEVKLNDIKRVAYEFNFKSYHNLKGFITTDIVRATYPS